MKQINAVEGPQAQENFEEAMKAIFKVSKADLAKAEKKSKKKRASGSSSPRKPIVSDRD